jgi:hypothetical protein
VIIVDGVGDRDVAGVGVPGIVGCLVLVTVCGTVRCSCGFPFHTRS